MTVPGEPPTPHGGFVRCGPEFCVELLVRGEEVELWLLDAFHPGEKALEPAPARVEVTWEARPGVAPVAIELRMAGDHYVRRMPVPEEAFYRGRTRTIIHRGDKRSEAAFVIDELDSEFARGRDY